MICLEADAPWYVFVASNHVVMQAAKPLFGNFYKTDEELSVRTSHTKKHSFSHVNHVSKPLCYVYVCPYYKWFNYVGENQ